MVRSSRGSVRPLDEPTTLNAMSTPMNDYDNRALQDIRAWQGRKPSRRLRNAIPESVRERAGELVDRGRLCCFRG